MIGLLRRRRRRALRAGPPDPHVDAELVRRCALLRRLPRSLRDELQGHARVLVAEKRFEGCGGFVVDDGARRLVAAQAAVLLLGRRTDYFPAVRTIFVYPQRFRVNAREHLDDWVEGTLVDVRSGESWDHGPVVLSWEDVETSARRCDGYNVVLHEFAHQLDLENGAMDGAPSIRDAAQRERWRAAFARAWERHAWAVEAGRRPRIDAYAARSPDEFFAVCVEAFFETPGVLRRAWPDVYDAMREYFGQDPLSW